MRSLLFCGLASLIISLAPSITAQEPTPSSVTTGGVLLDQLQGGWVLKSLEAPNLEKNSRQERAIMVVGGSFLFIELHLAWDLHNNDEWVDGYFQSGTSRIWVEPSGELVAKAMIGAATDVDYSLELEPPGKERRYHVRFRGNNEVELRMEEGAVFRFVRMRDERAQTDLFGRPIEDS